MMDAPEPPQPLARKRLPFEEPLKPFGSSRRLGLFLLVAAALSCGAAAYYFHVVRDLALTRPHVLGPVFGAAYFTLRALMTLRPRA